jgi:hypothetical protein
MSTTVFDERSVQRALGDRAPSLSIRLDRPWWRASWGSRRGATATSNGLLSARGATLGELLREILATDADEPGEPCVLPLDGAS